MQIERAGHRGRNQVGGGERDQLNQQYVAPERGKQRAGYLRGQNGLPDPARPGQRHHPVGGQQVSYALDSRLPPNEGRGRRRKVGHVAFGGSQGRPGRRASACALLANGPVPLKPIAASRDRLEQPAILPERLPDRGDMNLQRIVFDDSARPHPLKELVLGDELPAAVTSVSRISNARPPIGTMLRACATHV